MNEHENGDTTATTGASIADLARLAPTSIIRTETVLSKLPIHNLAKKGSIKISILRKGPNGQVELSWRVSPSRDYGEPRQLAYKIDTLIVNRRIDEEGRPLPPMIALGSIRQICRELGLNEGKGANDVKRAILQNSSAFISAKLTYKGNDGVVRKLDTNFARYSAIFTGEKLPDGRSADGVYLIPTEPYREVLNNARMRPLNYDYLRELLPTQQRFYEIVSYQIFAALKHRQPEAKMAYSEYCTYSAQERHLDRARVQKQMYKVHRPHVASGYLKAVRYQETVDGEGKPDWNIYYVPGPRARAEYHTLSNSGRIPDTAIEAEAEAADLPRIGFGKPRRQRQGTLRFAAPPEPVGQAGCDAAIAALTSRGVGAGKANDLVSGRDPDMLVDQLEWGDHLVRNAKRTIVNPAGFYIHLMTSGITPPEGFETSRKRRERDDAAAAADQERFRRLELENAYREYRAAAIDRHIDALPPGQADREIDAKMKEIRKGGQWSKNLPLETVREMAERTIRLAIADTLPLPTFEEFARSRQSAPGQGSLSFQEA